MRKFKNEGTDNVLAQCSTCKNFLPLNAYHKFRGRKYDIKSRCIECSNKVLPIDVRREQHRAWRERTGQNEKRRQQYSPERNFAQKLRYYYNMTPEEYDELLKSQGGTCAICPRSDILCVDHDHNCCPGKRSCGSCIRGILCTGCNQGLGRFNDNHELLLRAAEYLNAES